MATQLPRQSTRELDLAKKTFMRTKKRRSMDDWQRYVKLRCMTQDKYIELSLDHIDDYLFSITRLYTWFGDIENALRAYHHVLRIFLEDNLSVLRKKVPSARNNTERDQIIFQKVPEMQQFKLEFDAVEYECYRVGVLPQGLTSRSERMLEMINVLKKRHEILSEREKRS